MKYASPLYWLIFVSLIPLALPLSKAWMTFMARTMDLYSELHLLEAIPDLSVMDPNVISLAELRSSMSSVQMTSSIGKKSGLHRSLSAHSISVSSRYQFSLEPSESGFKSRSAQATMTNAIIPVNINLIILFIQIC